MDLSYLHSLILGAVEGITEFIPVSSTAHLRIVESIMKMKTDDATVTAYTAIIQVPAILAALIYFWGKIVRLVVAWFRGVRDPEARKAHDYTLAWAVIVGSIPIGIVGLALKGVIEKMSNLWVVSLSLIIFSVVLWLAERRHDQLEAKELQRGEGEVTVKDGLVLGLAQCLSPILPGVSRSGATISFGLFQGLTRVAATELSFFLAIPALVAAGGYETYKERHGLSQLPAGPLILGLVVSFVVAYASIAWLLRFVSTNSLRSFVTYRVAAGAAIVVALLAGWVSAT